MQDPRLEAIFDAALQKGAPAERAAFLEGACGHDAGLRDRVETLLRAHDAAGRFLQGTICQETLAEGPGATIGRYKLLQRIGEGGFGVVYMAEQLEPVRRKVALKIIKLGMDTRQVVARFESERQALALMDHPNIARVFDAGATDSGRPYFVMELVRGIAITEYCDQNSLSTRARLELFVQVCQAVQHAHQKGIIHRDIKPTNVLVTLHDGKPVPKVIDFGIAKATGQRLTDKTVFTEFRQIVGTPQYMSPEQAEMSGLDIDTRCDIYSLGVLLYELLTSTTPLEAAWLQSLGYAELHRVIREEEPPRPSLRVSTLQEKLDTVARNRDSEPQNLSRVLRGDLDWIVMKALEKDRTRRYATAGDLAADIERHLRHQPVEAGPPSVFYKLRKFARRNRTGVIAGAVVAAALVTGLTLATVGFVRAHREAARSREIAAFLEEIVVAVNPAEAESRHVDVEHVVARARELFGDDHATVAAALDGLALRVQDAGELTSAEALYRESERIWRTLYGDSNPNRARTLGRLGALLRLKGDDAGAETALRESLKTAAGLPEGMQLGFCDVRSDLAQVLQRGEHVDEAESLVREVLRIRRLHPQGQQYQIAATLEQLTQILIASKRVDEADQVFEETIKAYIPLSPRDSARTAYHNFAYGHWLRQNGRLEKAEPYLREAARIYRAMPNPPREYYLASLDGLFQLVRKREESFDESIALFHECMHNMGLMFGSDHPHLAAHYFGFSQFVGEKNHAAEAVELLVEGLRISRRVKGDDWESGPTLERIEREMRHIVAAADLPTEKYQAGLLGATVLLEERPGRVAYRHLRGMVLCRLARYGEAIADLEAVDDGASGSDREFAVMRLAFLAMAEVRAGHSEPARERLEEMRVRVAGGGATLGRDGRALAAEAERVCDAEIRK